MKIFDEDTPLYLDILKAIVMVTLFLTCMRLGFYIVEETYKEFLKFRVDVKKISKQIEEVSKK